MSVGITTFSAQIVLTIASLLVSNFNVYRFHLPPVIVNVKFHHPFAHTAFE
jgi:hypothetical protein